MTLRANESRRRTLGTLLHLRTLAIAASTALSACGGGGGAPRTSGGITLVLTPAEASVAAGGTVRFVAEVRGTTDQRARFDLVSGPGAVSAEGVYSAPPATAPGETASVRAIALADAQASAVATLRLGNGTGNGNGGSNPALEVLAAKAGTTLAGDVGEKTLQRMNQSVLAAVEAARLTQQPRPVLTGTLRNQNGQAVYEPAPADRLVVIAPSGPAVTFRIATMNGDFSNGGGGFLDADHDLDVQIELPESFDLQVTSQRRGRSSQRAVRGTAILEGNTFAVDLTEADTATGGGNQIAVQIAVRGSIEGQGVRVLVQDDVAVVVQNVSFFSVQTDRTFATTWDIGGTRYELRDGRLSKVFRDTRVTEPSYWRAEGAIFKDGVAIGSLRGDFEDRFYVVRLLRGDERIELQRIFLNN